ncbi:MAG TPA: hypothetical protein VL551_04065 [Actinospica sp.]|nr:hypothetical protein [Actinospica sp.]
MADLIPPEDLVALKAAWYAARAHATRLATVEPEGDQTIPRTAPANRKPEDAPLPPIRLHSEEQSIALKTARAEELEFALRLARHPWKRQQSDVHAAEKALNEAAFALWTRQNAGGEAA